MVGFGLKRALTHLLRVSHARRARVLNERVRLTALWRRIDLSLKAAAEGSDAPVVELTEAPSPRSRRRRW